MFAWYLNWGAQGVFVASVKGGIGGGAEACAGLHEVDGTTGGLSIASGSFEALVSRRFRSAAKTSYMSYSSLFKALLVSSSLWSPESSVCCTASKLSAVYRFMSHERAAALLVCMEVMGEDSPDCMPALASQVSMPC